MTGAESTGEQRPASGGDARTAALLEERFERCNRDVSVDTARLAVLYSGRP